MDHICLMVDICHSQIALVMFLIRWHDLLKEIQDLYFLALMYGYMYLEHFFSIFLTFSDLFRFIGDFEIDATIYSIRSMTN